MGEPGSDAAPGGVRGRPDEIEAVPVRHPWRWISGIAILLVAASIVNSAVNNPNVDWTTVGNYLFDSRILDGLKVTIEVSALSMLIGVVIGIVMAIMRISPNPAMSGVSWFYIWFFRGLPRYTLLFVFAFTLKALYTDITIGIPFANVVFTSFDANSLTLFQVAVIALGLSEGAYMAEIVRAGLISVDQGQTEAAQALGLSRLQTLRHVVLPQAMRVIVPPTGNEAISMVKDSALVAAIALADLQFAANAFKAKTYKVVPFDVIVVIWFLVLTSALYVVQYYLERRFGRGAARELPPTPRQRLVAAWRKWRPRQGEAAA